MRNDKVVQSMYIINRHCKGLTMLNEYLWEYRKNGVRCGEERLTEYPLADLDWFTIEHYGVEIHAEHNGTYGRDFPGVSEQAIDDICEMVGEEVGSEETFHPFIFPEVEPEKFRVEFVESDKKYLYSLKNKFIEYAIHDGRNEFEVEELAQSQVHGHTLMLVKINGREFHYRIGMARNDLKKEDYHSHQNRRIEIYYSETIRNAVKQIQDFLIDRGVKVEIPERWRN